VTVTDEVDSPPARRWTCSPIGSESRNALLLGGIQPRSSEKPGLYWSDSGQSSSNDWSDPPSGVPLARAAHA